MNHRHKKIAPSVQKRPTLSEEFAPKEKTLPRRQIKDTHLGECLLSTNAREKKRFADHVKRIESQLRRSQTMQCLEMKNFMRRCYTYNHKPMVVVARPSAITEMGENRGASSRSTLDAYRLRRGFAAPAGLLWWENRPRPSEGFQSTLRPPASRSAGEVELWRSNWINQKADFRTRSTKPPF